MLVRLTPWVVLVALLAAAPNSAESQRRRRRARPAPAATKDTNKDKDPDLGKKKDAGIDASLKEDLSLKKVEEREARPALQFERFRRTVELQVAEKRREQLQTLSKIIELGPSKKEAPDLLFRLSELYWEEAKHFFFQAGAVDDELIAARGNPDATERLRQKKKGFLAESDRHRREAVKQYREIVKRYPKYERMDEVLYSLGSNLWEQGNAKEALKIYKVLLRRFRDSEYAPDAYLAFGEYYFNEGQVRKALKAYKKAAEFTESKVYGFAMYKQGWCLYNLGLFDKALDLFKAVVFYGDISAGTSGDNKLAEMSP